MRVFEQSLDMFRYLLDFFTFILFICPTCYYYLRLLIIERSIAHT